MTRDRTVSDAPDTVGLRRPSALVDQALWPVLVTTPVFVASALLARGVPNLLVTPIVVGAFAAVGAVLERVRPEREEHRELDQPLWMEAAHFIVSFELGYALAMGACALVASGARALLPIPSWPTAWPMALQIALGILLYEATSYWQHRGLHRFPLFWRFHALHHSGERLNLVRAVRFHAVDIGTASFVAYLPLVLMAAPDDVFTLLGVLLSALGILQHANIRMRTPAWLDRVVCTPAVHRHHHSRCRGDSDRNFANTLMIFDVVFGTYGAPRAAIPDAIGIEDDPVPRRLWDQIVSPFRRGA